MAKMRKCVVDMRGYVPGEPPRDASVVKLNQNENRYPPSPAVAEAIRNAIDSIALYPDSTSRQLRETAAKVFGIDAEEVMASNGSDEMLRILFQSCCDPGDKVVAFYPSYTYYETLAAMHDVDYRLIDFEGEYRLPEKLDLAGVKLAFLPNPNAPTGTLFPEGEVRRFIESAVDGFAVVDEAYADFARYTAIPLIREYDNLVVVRTFSKSHALAGLRVGLGFARAGVLAEMEKVRDYYNLDQLAQAGAIAALRDRKWLAETSKKIMITRDRVTRAARELGLKVYDSSANFVMIRCAGPEQAETLHAALRDDDILVRYFKNRGIADCIRVSIGTDDDMDAFLAALKKALEPAGNH